MINITYLIDFIQISMVGWETKRDGLQIHVSNGCILRAAWFCTLPLA